MTPKEFVNWLWPAACNNEINPIFIVAQAALETGWGKKTIGKYNIFGITKGSWTGKTLLVTTTEIHDNAKVKYKSPEEILSITPTATGKFRYKVIREFRDYSSLEECLKDHFDLLSSKAYADAWPYRGDPYKFVEYIQNEIGPKYATAPNYVSVMKQMFKTVEKLLK